MAAQSDVIAGPARQPRNLSAHVQGSIHDDATAAALGFRGGTVAGSIHMDQFPPLLLEAFGKGWFETGCLSLYFRHATTDGADDAAADEASLTALLRAGGQPVSECESRSAEMCPDRGPGRWTTSVTGSPGRRSDRPGRGTRARLRAPLAARAGARRARGRRPRRRP